MGTLYEYLFDTDESAEWTLDSGAWDWDTANSRLKLTGTGVSSVQIICRITGSSAGFAFYEVELLDSSSIYPAIIFGYQDADNFYMARIDAVNDEVQLYKKVATVFTKIGFFSITINTNTYYVLKVEWIAADHIKVYLDGTLRIDQTTNLEAWTSGEVGLRAYGTNIEHAYYEYIKVWTAVGLSMPVAMRHYRNLRET